MKVKELIDILNKFQQDAEVCVPMQKSDKIEYFILNQEDVNQVGGKQNYEDFNDSEINGYGNIVTIDI